MSLMVDSMIVQPGGTAAITATTGNPSSGGIVWSATGGTLAANGSTATFTAPQTGGVYLVTATSSADATQTATVPVAVPTQVSLEPSVLALDATTSALLSNVSADQTQWTFTGSSSQLSSIQVGSVLVCGTTTWTPNGLAGRVDRKVANAGQTILTIDPVDLGEIIQTGTLADAQCLDLATASFEPSEELINSGFRVASGKPRLVPEIGPSNLADPGQAVVANVEKVVELIGPDDVKVTFSLDSAIHALSLRLSGLSIAEAHFCLGLKATLEENIKWNIWSQGFGPKTVTLGRLRFKPIVFSTPLCPIPVVVTPSLLLNLNATGSTAADFQISAEVSDYVLTGFDYDSATGMHEYLQHYPKGSMGARTEAEGQFDIALEPEVNFAFWGGVANVWAGLPLGLDLQASLNGVPWWTLDGTLNWHVGMSTLKWRGVDTGLHEIKRIRISEAGGGLGPYSLVPGTIPANGYVITPTDNWLDMDPGESLDLPFKVVNLEGKVIYDETPSLQVSEGSTGGSIGGTLGSTYTAPITEGTYHVVATSCRFPDLKSQPLAIQVGKITCDQASTLHGGALEIPVNTYVTLTFTDTGYSGKATTRANLGYSMDFVGDPPSADNYLPSRSPDSVTMYFTSPLTSFIINYYSRTNPSRCGSVLVHSGTGPAPI